MKTCTNCLLCACFTNKNKNVLCLYILLTRVFIFVLVLYPKMCLSWQYFTLIKQFFLLFLRWNNKTKCEYILLLYDKGRNDLNVMAFNDGLCHIRKWAPKGPEIKCFAFVRCVAEIRLITNIKLCQTFSKWVCFFDIIKKTVKDEHLWNKLPPRETYPTTVW